MHLKDPFYAFRESLKSVLGAPPDPCSLDARVLQVETLDGYRREKVTYQVAPNDWAYAYLLIPASGNDSWPTVICHHRHNRDWSLGKSEVVGISGDPNEAVGLELVRRGYVVFAPDAIAFEERRPPIEYETSDAGWQRLNDFQNNLRELSVRLLRGETLLKKVIYDASRAVDYLETRPEVDKNRIAFVGHGYGAKMAMWTAALDERIYAGVAHGSIGSMHEALRLEHNIQIEFSVPRLLQVADHDRIVGMVAPRPFLLSASKEDSESSDALDIYDKARRVYNKLGAAARLTLYLYSAEPDEPYFTTEARHRAYEWLDNWMKAY